MFWWIIDYDNEAIDTAVCHLNCDLLKKIQIHLFTWFDEDLWRDIRGLSLFIHMSTYKKKMR